MGFVLEKLQEVAGQLFEVLPSLLGALMVLLIGWLMAKIISRILEKVLAAIKVDVLADRLNQIDMVQSAELDIKPSKIISKVIYYLIMLIVVAVAADLMALKILSDQVNSLITFIPNLITAVLVMVFGLIISNMVKELLSTTFRSLGMSSGTLISSFVFYFLFISIVLTALKQVSIETSFIENNITLIIGGIVIAFGIGYGYASRNVMANLLGSLYSKPKFRTGDIIKVKGIQGSVVGMDNTSMTIRTTNNRRVIIPLSVLTENEVEIIEDFEDGTLIED